MVNPLLRRIEALADDGAYTVLFGLPDGQERSLVMRAKDGEISVPEANLIPGWPAASDSFQAAVAAVAAMHSARESAGPGRVRLSDVPGGWDVGLGNIVLADSGMPACVGHGELEPREGALFECVTCGALALFDGAE
jgi:hypothetical protein